MEETIPALKREEQFRSWVRSYSDLLYSHARWRGFDQDAAKDLVQDTFYAAWKNIEGFQGKSSVKNWLFVILKNKITDEFRKSVKLSPVQLTDHDPFFDEKGHWARGAFPKQLTVNPDDTNDRSELARILEGCSGKLNRVQKAVFFMKYIDDLESDAICVELSITANNYWTILHRAKTQLRSCLEKHWL